MDREEYDKQTQYILAKYDIDSKNLQDLGIKDLAYVRASMVNVMAHWYGIGLYWKIDPATLDNIQKKCRPDIDYCLTEMISEWLQNGERPIWKDVVTAISATGAGGNPAEAKTVAEYIMKNGEEICSTVSQAEGVDDTEIGRDAMRAVIQALEPVSAMWMQVGIILGLNYDFLRTLRSCDHEDRLEKLVKRWLKQKFDHEKFGLPSWKKLVEAIGARAGGADGRHALKIAKEHPSKIADSIKHTFGKNGAAVFDEVDSRLDMNAHQRVCQYVKDIDNNSVIELGQALGLNRMKLKRSSPRELVGEMVESWIRRDDDVLEVSGEPTWRNLSKALVKIGMNGIAQDIQKDFNFNL